MKLTAAKCPSCGADIKVDRNDETTICEYCNSTVIIDDAVEKYKLEISGKIKVSGIKDNDDWLNDAKNYIKLGEYRNANGIIHDVINEEPFNTEAFILCIKSYIGNFKTLYDDSLYGSDNEVETAFWEDIDIILARYERLKSIDEKSKFKSKLKEEIKVLEKMQKEKERLEKDIEICNRIDALIEEITSYKFKPEISKKVKRNYTAINKKVAAYFKEILGYEIIKLPDNRRCMHRNFLINYYDANSNYREHTITKYNSLIEIEEKIKDTKSDIIEKINKTIGIAAIENVLIMSSPLLSMIKNRNK